MLGKGKVQKWGNSFAVRLPSKLMAAAGIEGGNEVDIQADEGRLVIQLRQRTQEQAFDELFANEPGAAQVLGLVKASLARAISITDETTERCSAAIKRMEDEALH